MVSQCKNCYSLEHFKPIVLTYTILWFDLQNVKKCNSIYLSLDYECQENFK